jgi:hypothetical protein
MAVSVKLDKAHLTARLDKGKKYCGPILAQQILDDCRPFTPHDQGTLEDSGRVETIDGYSCATWSAVYAAYQYYGCWPDGSHVVKNHDTSKNARATTMWVEAAKKEYGKAWEQVAQNEFVKGANA